jgi:hypothetical protein
MAFDSRGRLDAGEREKAAHLAMDTLEPIAIDFLSDYHRPGKPSL